MRFLRSRTWIGTLVPSVFALGLALNTAHSASAAGGQFGLGVILGEPTGITSQYKLSAKTALNSGLAYSFNDWAQIYTDHIWKMPTFFSNLLRQQTRLIGTIGIGGLLGFHSGDDHSHSHDHNHGDLVLAVRLPVGGEYQLAEAPVAFFFELVPGLQLVDRTDLILQGGVGARYFF